MLTIVFLGILYASMSITALKAESDELLNIGEEFHHISAGNVFSAAVCSAPSLTDVVSTSMYKEFGASSRWLPLVSSAVGILIAVFGGSIIGYLPKLLMGATIFLFAFQTMYEWLYQNVRGFSRVDYAIIWIILFTTILVGFMQGIGIGIILTLLLFVFRYSRISAIQSRQTLRTLRSSVERSHAANRVLQRHGSSVIIYKLRGFLFFGTANSIFDRIADTEQFRDGQRKAILMDFKRVTGMDISALNTFIHIKKLCDSEGVLLTFSGVPQKVRAKLIAVDAASMDGAQPLIFDESDFAVEYLENNVLEQSKSGPDQLTVRDYLMAMIGDENKVRLLLQAMNKKNCQEGEILFKQGEADSGFYVIEKGALSAFITTAGGDKIRVRKFSRGSLIGELSAYLYDKHRTATVIADEDSVIYHLDPQKLDLSDSDSRDLKACIHEMVAMTLAERVSFMNNRLLTRAS
jgi:SulP family sulfate permease